MKCCNRPNNFQCGKSRLSYNSVLLPSGESCATTLKAKFYRPSTVQPLTQDHMNQRKVFCNWLLDKPEDFVQKIIWTDEKIFVLNQRPNRKNDGTWSTENPHQENVSTRMVVISNTFCNNRV